MNISTLQKLKFAKSIVPQSINDTDTDGTGVDTRGFACAAFVFHLGATTAAFDASGLYIEDSNDNSTYGAVTGGAISTMPTSTDDEGFWVIYVDLRKTKRYIRWAANPGAAATLLTGFAILGGADEAPDSVSERGLVGQAIV